MALRVIFGSDPAHISLLYLLMYARAAGGFTPLISDLPKVGGQEFKVKVSQQPMSTIVAITEESSE